MAKDSKQFRPAHGLALLVGAALVIAAGAANADDPILDNAVVADGVTVPTQAQCQSAWDDSGAADTCGAGVSSNYYGSLPAATVRMRYNWSPPYGSRTYDLIVWAGCSVEVQCMPAGQGADRTVKNNLGVDNDWRGELDDTSDLNNCNGTLTAGSC